MDGEYTFDGNVAVASENSLVMAVAEERISRKKYDGNFHLGLHFVLDRLNANPDSIEAVAVSSFGKPTENHSEFEHFITSSVQTELQNNVPVYYIKSHHEAHAVAAACQCPFDEALIAVVDNTGSIIGPQSCDDVGRNAIEQSSYFLFRNGNLELIARDHDEPGQVGFGRVYSKVTRYIGFDSYQESGKTMGLAPFGNPNTLDSCNLYETTATGKLVTSMTHDVFSEDGLDDLRKWFEKRGVFLAKPRQKNERIRPFDMDLARWVQEQLQNFTEIRLKDLIAQYNVCNLCLVGGVALNSVMNHYLEEKLKLDQVFIPPSPGDAGIAIGAAAWYLWQRDSRIPSFGSSPYLGPNYSVGEIESAIMTECNGFDVEYIENPCDLAAYALSQDKIIAWYQGRSEFGPRALGNRSIIASPHNNWTKEILNHQVKQREWFRPYAPAVKTSRAAEYFKIRSEVPYMMKTARVISERYSDIPSCVHVDETARVQTVSEESNPSFHQLIDAFEKLSGIPVVLNTSFNLAGMPIVESPLDAISCFRRAFGLSHLFLDNYMITKRNEHKFE